MANVSNLSTFDQILDSFEVVNLTEDFTFRTSTIVICDVGGVMSLLINIGLLIYAKLNFSFLDPFDGPVLAFLVINVLSHIVMGIFAIVAYYEESVRLWSCRAFSFSLKFMAYAGKYIQLILSTMYFSTRAYTFMSMVFQTLLGTFP